MIVVFNVADFLAGGEGGWWDAVSAVTLALAAGLALWGVGAYRRASAAEARRRERQASLEAAFAHLDVIVEHVPIGLALFDRDLRYVRINSRLAAMNGLPEREHVGRTVAEVLPELPPEVADDLRRVLDTARPLSEVHVTGHTPASNGRREWLSSYWPVQEDGAVTGVGIVVLDVTERRQAQHELRAQTDRYEALLLALSEAGEGMLVLEDDGRCVYANAAFEQLSGYPFPELAAMDDALELVLPDHRAEARRRVALRIEQGGVDPDHRWLTIRRRDGARVDLEVVGVPLHVEGRDRLVVVVHDVTEQRRIGADRERLRRRSALLAEASDLFDETLDEAAALERVARLCVRELADTCVAVLADGPGAIRGVAAAARDPQVEPTLLELQLRYPVEERPMGPVADALRSGRSHVLEPIADEMIEAGAIDDRDRELILATGARAAIVVPLRARGSVRGALALGFRTLDGEDGEELVALLEDLGRRAAVALETARLYEERGAVARTLQRSLLPPELPDVPGMEVAARYLAAGEGDEVGGDFYDCFPTAPDAWAAVIGDVCGKGAEAAALTALARHTIRAAVVHDPQPAAVLRELNDAILRHETDYRFCTVLYVRLVPACDGNGIDACIATGGHPLPLIVRACGAVEPAGRPGTMLGVVSDPEIAETTVRLRPGDALVLFTDGVIEGSPAGGALAPGRLADYLASCAGRDAGRIAAGVESRVLELQQGRPRDDVAVVVLRVAPGATAPFVAAAEGVAAAT